MDISAVLKNCTMSAMEMITMHPSTSAVKTAGGLVKGFFARANGRVGVAKRQPNTSSKVQYEVSEEENHDWSDVPTFEEEEAAQAEEAREAAEADRIWEREHGGGWAVEADDDFEEFRTAQRRAPAWAPRSCTTKPKPITTADLAGVFDEEETRQAKIAECTEALAGIRQSRERLEAELAVTAGQQGHVEEQWTAADAAYQERVNTLHRLREVSLPAILAETEEARNVRCAGPLASLRAAKAVLAETRQVSETKVPRPADGSAQRLFTAWKQALTRRTAATESIPGRQADVATAQAALVDFIAQPERNIRARIATCEEEVTATAAVRAKCREAKVRADVLRIQLDNLRVYEARAADDLHHATYDGFDVIVIGKPRSTTSIAREAKDNELHALEANPPMTEVDGWTDVDRDALAKMRAAIEAKYAIKEEVAAPTRATATVVRDGVLSFAELLRWRHELPEAAAPEPVRKRLFPNARVLTDEEARTRAAQTESLFVANLSEDTTDEDLQDLFRPFGRCRVKLPKDRRTGAVRGFAFINFDRIQDAQEALVNLNGWRLHHMVISVKQAEEREEEHPVHAAVGGGGGGGNEEGANHDATWAQLVGARLPANFH
jgi:hypothetical protein